MKLTREGFDASHASPPADELDALRAENDALRARITALEIAQDQRDCATLQLQNRANLWQQTAWRSFDRRRECERALVTCRAELSALRARTGRGTGPT